ncbi:MAG: glycosyltransferase [Hyphomicrobiaceae bacterium]
MGVVKHPLERPEHPAKASLFKGFRPSGAGPQRDTRAGRGAVTRRPRVLMIGKFFPPVLGGIEEYVKSLADLLGERYDLTVLVHSQDRATHRESQPGYRLVRAGTWATVASQPLSPAMLREVLAERYDLIHLHVPNVLGLALVSAFSRGARIVVTHHADMVGFGLAGRIAAAIYRRMLRRCEVVTVLSLKNRDLAEDVRGVDVPFAALPLAIDPARYAETETVREHAAHLRRTFAADGSVLFAFVGRLVPYKGLDVLVEAMRHVEGARCLIAGDGKERESLQAAAAAAGVADRMVFLGAVDEDMKIGLLRAADAFVLPSISTAEAFGIVQVEAQLCGLPIVTTDLPTGVTDVTRHEETGLVVPPGDAALLAAAMRRLVADAAFRRRLGAGGLARAQGNYVPDAVRRTAFEIYDRALGS